VIRPATVRAGFGRAVLGRVSRTIGFEPDHRAMLRHMRVLQRKSKGKEAWGVPL
jgi:hypothetical protein